MKLNEVLSFIQQDIHTVILATIDEYAHPITCAIDIMLEEKQKLYFITARGKSLYKRLMQNQHIAFTALKGSDTMSSIAISFQGKVRNIHHEKLDTIFHKNPYMNTIYPNEVSRNVLEVFEIYAGTIHLFDLSKQPIYRKDFTIGNISYITDYYKVNDQCIGCFQCYQDCPQTCIDTSKRPVIIQHDHCLHCGKCMEVCPVNAIERIQEKHQKER